MSCISGLGDVPACVPPSPFIPSAPCHPELVEGSCDPRRKDSSLRPIFAISAELTPAACCKSFFFISKSIRSFQSILYEIISKCTHSVTSGLSEKRFVTYKKTRHHQDFYLNNAWFMFSNPARQMPYISNFRGLLFYDHPYRGGCFSFSEINKLILEY